MKPTDLESAIAGETEHGAVIVEQPSSVIGGAAAHTDADSGPDTGGSESELRGSRRLLLAILATALANGLVWMALIPPWQAPDEPKHFEYVRLVAEGGRVFAFQTEDQAADPELQRWILQSMDGAAFWWYGNAPGYDPVTRRVPERFSEVWSFGSHTAFYRSSPAYYTLAAWLQPSDRALGLYAARLLGVLLGVAIVLFTALAAEAVFPKDSFVRFGAPAFVALHPMFAFTQSAVNNDVLANALAAVTALVAVRLVVRAPTVGRILVLFVAALGAVLVKRTAFFAVFMAALAVVMWLALRSGRPKQTLGTIGAAVCAFSLAVAAWWAAGGGAVVPQGWRWTAVRYLFNEPDQPARIAAYLRTPGSWPILGGYTLRVGKGFWGVYGWEAITLPIAAYALGALAAAAAIYGLYRRQTSGRLLPPQAGALLVLATAPVLIALGAAAFFASYLYLSFAPPPQSRYLMAAVLPIAILLTAGWSAFIPTGRSRRALVAFIAAMALFDAMTILGAVIPYFYG